MHREGPHAAAPRATGNLARRGIDTERVVDADGVVKYLVGWTEAGFYGRFVEDGTEDTAPQPHLIPAAIKNGAGPPAGGDAR